MLKGDKRWIAAGLLAVAAGMGAFALLHHRRSEQAMRQRAADDPRSRGLAASDVSAPAWPAVPETKEQIEAEVTRSLAAWRQAILVRDADTVIALDRAFLAAPDRYRAALEASAKTETDERVRAFSTRELGKYRNPAHAPLFEALLADKSPFVRQNAAWGLGELAAQDDGRAAARRAVAELRHARAKDPAPAVRTEAKTALARLE
jgi:HEAT repeat protein